LASSSGHALAKALYKVPFPWAGIWRAYPSLLPRIPPWGRVFDLSLAEAGRGGRHPVPGLCRSCRGQSCFWPDSRWEALSSSPGSSFPWWSRQPAAGATGPSGGAGLLVLMPWRLLGCQPAYCPACGAPPKSSPRQKVIGSHKRFNAFVIIVYT
jgi:hypothetical protein